VIFPFSRQLEKLTYLTVPEKGEKEVYERLDKLFFQTPSVAVEVSDEVTGQMAFIARKSVEDALELQSNYSEALSASVVDAEEKLDKFEDRITGYLVELSAYDLSDADAARVAELLHVINDFERMGDHALNLQESAKEIHDKGVQFSASADTEFNSLLSALIEIMEYAFKSFNQNDLTLAKRVEPLEETIDYLTENIRLRHIRRLQTGECTVQLGFIHSDLLTNFERVSDHCSNIALSVLEAQDISMDRHAYLHDLKKDTGFTEALANCMEKYQLPKI